LIAGTVLARSWPGNVPQKGRTPQQTSAGQTASGKIMF